MINKWQFCAAKLVKSPNYASSGFFPGFFGEWKHSSWQIVANIMPAKSIKAYFLGLIKKVPKTLDILEQPVFFAQTLARSIHVV